MNVKVVHKPNILLAHLLEQEQARNSALLHRYQQELDVLPKGRPYIRRKGGGGRSYVYLSRRVPRALYPESKYVGPVGSEAVVILKQKLKDRSRLEAQLKALALERRMIEKALHEYRRARQS